MSGTHSDDALQQQYFCWLFGIWRLHAFKSGTKFLKIILITSTQPWKTSVQQSWLFQWTTHRIEHPSDNTFPVCLERLFTFLTSFTHTESQCPYMVFCYPVFCVTFYYMCTPIFRLWMCIVFSLFCLLT